jgi:hypothetical protein
MTTLAAVAACAVLAALAVFQTMLAAGAPLGRYAWGGQHPGPLPLPLRVGSLISLLVYAVIALVLVWRAGLVTPALSDDVVRVAAWCVAGYFLLGTALNAASRSRAERNLMTPTAAALCALSSVVALSP